MGLTPVRASFASFALLTLAGLFVFIGCGNDAKTASTSAPGAAGTAAPATWRIPVRVRSPVWLAQGPLGRNALRVAADPGDGVTLVTSEGAELWSAPVSEPPGATLTAPPVFLADGGLGLCTSQGVFRLDGGGSHRWRIPDGPCHALERGRHQPLVALVGDSLLSLSWEGAVEWRVDVKPGAGLAVLADGTVAVVEPGVARAYRHAGELAWELRDDAIRPPAVGSTDSALFVAAGTGAARIAPGGGDLVRVPGTGPPLLALPDGAVAAVLDGRLSAIDRTAVVRWSHPCAVANLVAFGRIVCAGPAGATVLRADGAELDHSRAGSAALAATATPEWLVVLEPGEGGAATLVGYRR